LKNGNFYVAQTRKGMHKILITNVNNYLKWTFNENIVYRKHCLSTPDWTLSQKMSDNFALQYATSNNTFLNWQQITVT